MMAPTLPDLPIEVLDHIIDELPETAKGGFLRRHDLHSFRSACRTLENNTRVRFGKESFGALKIRVRPGSFQTAHNVANNDDFRKILMTLNIDFGDGPKVKSATMMLHPCMCCKAGLNRIWIGAWAFSLALSAYA